MNHESRPSGNSVGSTINRGLREHRDKYKRVGALLVEVDGPPSASTGLTFRYFADAHTMTEWDDVSKTDLVSGLENLVNDDVDCCTFCRSVCVIIDHVSVVNHVTKIGVKATKSWRQCFSMYSV
jgi:hypothetical protein